MFKKRELIGREGGPGQYRRCEEVGLFEKGGPSSGAPPPFIPVCQGGEAECYAGSDKEEKFEAYVSDQEAIIRQAPKYYV